MPISRLKKKQVRTQQAARRRYLRPTGRREALRASARKRGIPFGLSVGEVEQLMESPGCHYCSRPLINGGGIHNPATLSIDRMNPREGYESDNVVACCLKCNRFKSNDIPYMIMCQVGEVLKPLFWG